MAEADTATNQPTVKKKRRKGMPGKNTKPCSYLGCNGWAWAQGYCSNHYHKLRREGVIEKKRVFGDDLARFHTKFEVNPDTGCWEWIAAIHPRGYGQFTIEAGLRTMRSHRYAYEKLVGPIPPGMDVLHKCDVRRCVCPDHLFLGRGDDNAQDCVAKGRHAAQNGKSGPKLTPAMVMNIRVMYALGLTFATGNKPNPFSIRNISLVYQVQEQTIRGIVKSTAHLSA